MGLFTEWLTKRALRENFAAPNMDQNIKDLSKELFAKLGPGERMKVQAFLNDGQQHSPEEVYRFMGSLQQNRPVQGYAGVRTQTPPPPPKPRPTPQPLPAAPAAAPAAPAPSH